MKTKEIKKPDKNLIGEVKLPASKSISNRILIIRALSDFYFEIKNLSDSDDTKVLDKILSSNDSNFNVGHAGTAMRFLTAYLSRIVGEWTLSGSKRMQQRPIRQLVSALKDLGADINYMKNDGYPPIKIFGKNLIKSKINIDASISSQFISALLLIAPLLPEGLEITLNNKISSKPYIDMTLALMKCFNVKSRWDEETLIINPQKYNGKSFKVENDWSAAAFWYAMAFLSETSNLLIKGLWKNSLQGDSKIAEIYDKLGINTEFINDTIRLTKINKSPEIFQYDLSDYPDLAQSLVVAMVFRNIPFSIYGLESLHIKETDRIQALITELSKFGFVLHESSYGVLEWKGEICQESTITDSFEVETYNDHRMAMAFAPIALVRQQVIIKDPIVVTKSYPKFWEELISVGFDVK